MGIVFQSIIFIIFILICVLLLKWFKKLTILPLVDFYTKDKNLKTEAGVSYLIKADDTTILMDVGFNQKKEHPSPLIHNIKNLDISIDEIDSIFISHLHLDHVGGMWEQKNKQFSLTQGVINLPEIPVYSPVQINPSHWNPGPKVEIVKKPKKLKQGIASTGSIPRCLFLMGDTLEQSLAINVENKGIVLIVGCGHQTIERIIERAQLLFNEPIYAIIGGLHFPVKSGRIMLGPVNLQNIVGTDKMPWHGINETDVQSAITAIQQINPQYVALSPHDSSDWSIDQFKTAFKEKYHEIMVGKKLEL
ncbi:MAG: MBL fold metallo-hydrolase [Desulfobacteraceae bacterium 4572_19]|nr:MAG: MBL fold metallo-hydrolase [Desulfobacteraceae bacterium 4572_19]